MIAQHPHDPSFLTVDAQPYLPEDGELVAALFAACGLNPAERPDASLTNDLTTALLLHAPTTGCVAFGQLSAGPVPHTRLLLDVIVHPAHYEQGLHGILLGWAEDEARDTLLDLAPPAARVVLATWVTSAPRCYTFAGFEPVLTEGVAALMEKEIRAGE